MADAKQPNEELRLLLVSKAFYHMGGSCFYAFNKFALSSLGELARYLKGIGEARRQQLTQISINWIGSRMPQDKEPTEPKWNSIRTRALQLLPRLIRLEAIDIHLDETNDVRRRRGYEDDATQAILLTATSRQFNNRKYRSLRTIQGMDYVYQFRGLRHANVYDYARQLASSEEVHDAYFVEDLRMQVCDRKKKSERRAAKWDNLNPLVSNWQMPKKGP